MKITKDELNHLLMHSSDVEEIEKNSPLFISSYPRKIYLDTATLKVVICPEVFRRGIAPRFNSKENILFFAGEVHLHLSLRKWGLAENCLDEFIIEIIISEKIVEEQTKEEIVILQQHIINSKILMVMFIALLAQRRPRRSKFPLINPVRTQVQAGYFFTKIS